MKKLIVVLIFCLLLPVKTIYAQACNWNYLYMTIQSVPPTQEGIDEFIEIFDNTCPSDAFGAGYDYNHWAWENYYQYQLTPSALATYNWLFARVQENLGG